MSEITKLYENAGVSKEPAIIPSSGEVIYWKNYSPFTAEKQIELIKWLSDFADFGTFSIDHNKSEYGIAYCINDDGHYFVDKIFEECIAKSVSYLWQFLTEEEQQQVKGILE